MVLNDGKLAFAFVLQVPVSLWFSETTDAFIYSFNKTGGKRV